MTSVAATDSGKRGREQVPIEKYVSASKKLDLNGIDFQAARSVTLPEATVESLMYIADVEGGIITFVRDVMATSLIDDPDTARFLNSKAGTPYWRN